MDKNTHLNYDELSKIVKVLTSESDDYAQIVSVTNSKMDSLRKEWEGEAADKFFAEMNGEVVPATLKASKSMLFAHDVLLTIMKTIYEADQETSGFFKNLDFGSAAAGGLGTLGVSGLAGAIAGADFGAGIFNQAGAAAGSIPDGTPPAAGAEG
ncbi:MAG: WXG100 family type VII secretion target, partial [Chloroflexota bacterium]